MKKNMDNLISQFEQLSLDLNLIRSSRNKKDGFRSWLLIDDEKYEYKTAYESKQGKITWRCNNTDFQNCKGSKLISFVIFKVCFLLN